MSRQPDPLTGCWKWHPLLSWVLGSKRNSSLRLDSKTSHHDLKRQKIWYSWKHFYLRQKIRWNYVEVLTFVFGNTIFKSTERQSSSFKMSSSIFNSADLNAHEGGGPDGRGGNASPKNFLFFIGTCLSGGLPLTGIMGLCLISSSAMQNESTCPSLRIQDTWSYVSRKETKIYSG